ncbi:MAG: proline--tRNA ligase [Methylotenera sp. 24-45-7]|jgi:prolyl-tRNA synthetase|nr:MAG: proline--tRNA ligase [Methylophilales bacterium 16-45-9]OYZ41788.1 MAG: proline--tRNA ligase [Methylotenera sp. 24-45-7]OZA10055.1 MAG: proline--tRNA ligase [Methylotenera sp. 17-45-7]OZA50100.1 MAG: proline--tRNA ligase [Methylophilales bacterium 39-45-7]HQS37874.1 proline--tRNA ligase [Methylotenera sp.]
MRASQFFFNTQKEAPNEAELPSHILMVRAGLIKRLGSGLYSWMPLGLRVMRKVEAVVRDEMNKAGALELLMPAVQPKELWEETGRWAVFGPQMLKIQDRHEREFCFGPTHEEVITDIARKEIRSYKQLPLNFYQIQTKFRDEIRPRFGVMRAREFMMKDAYSFHTDFASLEKTYQTMYQAYSNVFTRLGLKFRAVKADTGAIGGDGSHEFHVLADSGEDGLAYCDSSDFAANVELAAALPIGNARAAATETMREVDTPKQTACEDVAKLLGIGIERTVKAIALIAAGKFYLALLRGDHTLNEVKLGKLAGFADFRFATEEEIRANLNCPPGFIGPVAVGANVTVIADSTVALMSDFVCGANKPKFHLAGVNFGRDLAEPVLVADIRNVVAGDASPDGKGILSLCRGIEVGHIFQLRTKYAAAMNATYLDENGQTQVMEMGCYGIGVSRIVGAAIEQGNDERGIIFPKSMAPFEVVICAIGIEKSEAVKAAANKLHDDLQAAGVDVLLDDRGERPGVMFAEADLMGIPHRLVIGERGLAEGNVEYKGRTDVDAKAVALSAVLEFVQKLA